LKECVQNSLLNEKTKKSTLSLIRKYENYCSKELAKNIKVNLNLKKFNQFITLKMFIILFVIKK
jgi:hypothetical protein